MRWVLLGFLVACGGGTPSDPCSSPIDVQWGTEQDDEALALIPAAGGGVYVGGYDPFVMCFDAGGTLTGTWQGGTAADEEPTAVAIDSCGRVLIAGWNEGALAGAGSSGRRDAFLLEVRLRDE